MDMQLNDELRRMRYLSGMREGMDDNIFYHGTAVLFDKFDLGHVGSGDGLNKYGFGFYFTKNPKAAEYYAKENAIGTDGETIKIYECRLLMVNEYLGWEEEIPYSVQSGILDTLRGMGKNDEAEQMESESGGNGYPMWTARELYEWLQHTVDGQRGASALLAEEGVPGIWAQGVHAGIEDTIYVCFDDKLIRIMDVTDIK